MAATRVRVLSRISEIDAAAWDACAGDGDPFVSHAFLNALEETGCATEEQGWLPQHLCIEDDAGGIAAAAPLYLKAHSFGEYVFDWGWAKAYERIGRDYYPKLQCCVPFTPVTGPRLLVRSDDDDGQHLRATLLSAMVGLARRHDASSVHVTFPTEAEWRLGGEAGLLRRSGIQYHWHNRGYRSFDDFLEALLGRKRKQIRRERREAAATGTTFRVLTGDDLKPEHWLTFHRFYLNTISRKWAQPYLTRDLFLRIGETMADRIALVLAIRDGEPVAGALNFLGANALYGRYWGCRGDDRFLHFETCYYRAIDLAIELGLERVEAGAQGEHKIARGYLPALTYSLHWLADPQLGGAVADFLSRESDAISAELAALAAESPYRDRS